MNEKAKLLGKKIDETLIKNKYQKEEIELFLEVIESLEEKDYDRSIEDLKLELFKIQNKNTISAVYYSKEKSSLDIETYYSTGLIELQSLSLEDEKVIYSKCIIDIADDEKELASYKVEIKNKREIYEYSFLDGEDLYQRKTNGTITVNGQIVNIPSTRLVELKEIVDTKIKTLKTTAQKTYEK